MGRAGTGAVELRGLVPRLTAELPQIVAEVVELLRAEWPDYAELLAADTDDIQATAQVALLHLVKIAEAMPRQRSRAGSRESLGPNSAFEEIGRVEFREGRSLGQLLSAYRAGARVAWRRLSDTAVERGLEPAALARLAEAVFVFVEELSSASAKGYVEEQRTSAVERERLRSQLGELLVSDRTDSTVVAATALRAGWPMPTHGSLLLVDPADSDHGALLSRLDAQCLPIRHGTLTGAIDADPTAPGRRSLLARRLRGLHCVIGPTVPITQLPTSVRVTEAAVRLSRAGVLPHDPLFVDEHLDALVVSRDPWLIDRLRGQALAPLADVPESTRARLEETLGAWLSAMGDRRATAQVLQVHPQTVRYRLRQLQDLFGEALDDPQERLRLMLALCW